MYMLVWRQTPCSRPLKARITLLCYSLLIFSSRFLLFFYHISAFFFVAYYLQKFLITAGLKEKKIPRENILHWNLIIYASCHVWCRSIQINSGGGDVFVSFSSWNPHSHFCGSQETPELLARPKADNSTPSDFYRGKMLWIVLHLWPHTF